MTIAVNYRAFPRSLDRESPDSHPGTKSTGYLSIQAEYIGGVWPKQGTHAIAEAVQSQGRPAKSARLPRENPSALL